MNPLKLLLATLLFCAQSAQAADHLRYAVVSLVGDQLTVAARKLATGTRLNRTENTVLSVQGLGLDDEVLDEVDKLLPALAPGAQVSLLGLSSSEAYSAPTDKLLQLPALQKALQAEHPDRIVLIRKLRSDARLQLSDGNVGNGYLEGLGFYIDSTLRLEQEGAGRTDKGFISPYVYIQLTLLDGRDLREIGTVPITASRPFAASASPSGLAWDALMAEEKVAILRTMLQDAVRTKLPRLLASETRRK
ncbi:hypothetical protein [Niveibacterium terrae]|uniref:hypothetical protein n=1 Tax=Niveibacterium terrae TaxID=3373598 RepID=UPI003A95B278